MDEKARLRRFPKQIKNVPPENRREFGQTVNELKNNVAKAIENRLGDLKKGRFDAIEEIERIDVTLPGLNPPRGHLHPLTQIQSELEDIFSSMGFAILDGPELETDENNFEKLNIPGDHPARDMQDTFWTKDGNLLRTHTSPIQIRGMAKMKPPLRIVGPGRVFRYENIDASHEHTFYQMEGLMVDRDISVSHLIHFMRTLLAEIFQGEVKVRLRPGYFPFVEPGFELDFNCRICGGKGCSTCKHTGWVELIPCGLVHPNVLRMSGIDSDKWSGFAFGLGLSQTRDDALRHRRYSAPAFGRFALHRTVLTVVNRNTDGFDIPILLSFGTFAGGNRHVYFEKLDQRFRKQ